MASLTQWTCFEQTLGDGEGKGSLVCCIPQGPKELDSTQQLNSNIKPLGVKISIGAQKTQFCQCIQCLKCVSFPLYMQ